MPAPLNRSALIQKIHIAKTQLGIADDIYRDIIANHADGKTSCAACTALELDRVLSHMKRLGFKPRKPKNKKPVEPRPLVQDVEIRKARALWLWLHDIGIVKNPSEAALTGFAKRTCRVDSLRWVRGKSGQLIEAIKEMAKRQLPGLLIARIKDLQAVGLLADGVTLDDLLDYCVPLRRGVSFDGLQAVWQALDRIENDSRHSAS